MTLLREQIHHLYNKLFSRRREKNRYAEESPQLPLFDMPEPDPDEVDEEKTEVGGYTRCKKERKPLPANLPRMEIIHDLDEQEKICHCGAHLSRIREEVSEKLDIIPAVIQVVRHIRPKYSCKQCENIAEQVSTVKIVPLPVQLLAKAIASGGLMAHILTAKFADACMPLKNLLRQEILSGPLSNADETTVGSGPAGTWFLTDRQVVYVGLSRRRSPCAFFFGSFVCSILAPCALL